jgi:glycosyltransferase involved in cell wall biosynthesis
MNWGLLSGTPKNPVFLFPVNTMKIVAYLAPELPALSATFVYNEILALQEHNYRVVPFSVHSTSATVDDERVHHLAQQTICIYNEGLKCFIAANIRACFFTPGRYFRTLATAMQDVVRLGVLNRKGLGQCYRFLAGCRLAELLRQMQCEHLHVHFAHVPTDIAMYAATLADIPFSFTGHANDLFERGWLIAEKIKRSKFVATISEFNREYMISHGGNGGKIHVIRCGIDSRRFVAPPFIPCVAPYRVGTLGRMVDKKGFDIALQALAILRGQDDIALQMEIAGSGPLEDDLRQLVNQLGLEDIVDFSGAKSNSEVPAWMQTLDLFVLPCRRDKNGDMDGIPVVLMEAMQSGVPVISTRISGIPELICHEQEGLLVEPEAPLELAEAMKLLLEDNALRKKVRDKAIRKIKEDFDQEVNIRRLIHYL